MRRCFQGLALYRLVQGFDWLILFLILGILSFGFLLVLSLSPNLFQNQVAFFLLGLAAFFLFSFFDYRLFRGFFPILLFLAIFLLFLPFLWGEVTRGAVRWVQLGPLSFQPSEMAKPLLILFLAGFLGRDPSGFKPKIFSLFLLALPAFLIFNQPDLGSTLVILAIWLGMILAQGLELKLLFFLFGLGLIGLPFVWLLLKDYQKLRILTFINPKGDPLGAGYNLIQAMIAVGSGEIFGRGLGRGTQGQLAFLPERTTDFIFASLAEELGLAGCLILLLLFFFLSFRILNVAQEAPDSFGYFICVGVFSLLVFQVFVNVGVNIGILPITGITLPLVSQGGSSLLALLISLGLVESVARAAQEKRRIRQPVLEIK